eukprot:TRINITY_DN65954_c0_g1_i1.p1 TRINITY_DN65954_c0_g1~~TRINITY_DN65954_c0_g1_i1.p1  ORF type:complete len:424 (-),score=83.65 TRINITY_DN65954_c0_g1_i1:216-1487(-)
MKPSCSDTTSVMLRRVAFESGSRLMQMQPGSSSTLLPEQSTGMESVVLKTSGKAHTDLIDTTLVPVRPACGYAATRASQECRTAGWCLARKRPSESSCSSSRISAKRSRCERRIKPGHQSASQAFLLELYTVLARMSPQVRRKTIETVLSERLRLELEACLLAKSRAETVVAKKRVAPNTEVLLGHRRGAAATTMRFGRPEAGCIYGLPSKDDGCTRGIVLYSQRLSTGDVSEWYYATVCLLGLHIIGRMHRDRAAAAAEHEALTAAKRRASNAMAAGIAFEAAVGQAFATLVGQPGKRPNGDLCSGLRFYAAVQVGHGYRTLLRSPSFHCLQRAIEARAALCEAAGPDSLAELSYAACRAVLERLQKVFLRLHAGRVDSEETTATAEKKFSTIHQRVLEQRDQRARARIVKMLRMSAAWQRR